MSVVLPNADCGSILPGKSALQRSGKPVCGERMHRWKRWKTALSEERADDCEQQRSCWVKSVHTSEGKDVLQAAQQIKQQIKQHCVSPLCKPCLARCIAKRWPSGFALGRGADRRQGGAHTRALQDTTKESMPGGGGGGGEGYGGHVAAMTSGCKVIEWPM